MTRHPFRCRRPQCPCPCSKREMAGGGLFALSHPRHSHPCLYCGLNLSSLDIAIAPLKPAPSLSLQTRGGVFDTIGPRLISTVDTALPVLTAPCLDIAIIESILGASHALVVSDELLSAAPPQCHMLRSSLLQHGELRELPLGLQMPQDVFSRQARARAPSDALAGTTWS
jgi:hypothetical protein